MHPSIDSTSPWSSTELYITPNIQFQISWVEIWWLWMPQQIYLQFPYLSNHLENPPALCMGTGGDYFSHVIIIVDHSSLKRAQTMPAKSAQQLLDSFTVAVKCSTKPLSKSLRSFPLAMLMQHFNAVQLCESICICNVSPHMILTLPLVCDSCRVLTSCYLPASVLM